LVAEYQRLSAVAEAKRREFDRALRELLSAERDAERAGCQVDRLQESRHET
jgi:hypothetical protein